MDVQYFICPFIVNKYLGCFHALIIMNNTAKNICVFIRHMFPYICPLWMDMLHHNLTLFNCIKNSQTFLQSTCIGKILHFHQQCMRVPISPHPHLHLILSFFQSGYKAVSHWSSDLYFLDGWWCWESSHVLYWPSACLLWRSVYSGPCLFFSWALFLLSCNSFFNMLHKIPYQIYSLQTFSPILWVFPSSICVFWYTKVFNIIQVQFIYFLFSLMFLVFYL